MGFMDDDDDHFFKHNHFHNHDDDFDFSDHTMDIVGGVIGFVVFALVVLCVIRCCCNRSRGQVLAPPPSVPPIPPGANNPYPQQQPYVAHPAPAMYPPNMTVIPTASPAPYPAPYASVPSPYPPVPAPYPGGMPQPQPYAAVPNAPDAHALPPSYEQVMGPAEAPHAKQPPYNPYLSH